MAKEFKYAGFGNQNAKKAKIWEQALKRALARWSGETVHAGLDKIADTVVRAAGAGDMWAIKEIGDRVDGRAAQSSEVTVHEGRKRVEELSDAELADIASGRGSGTADAESGPSEPAEIH
jgi:hypothetical protein